MKRLIRYVCAAIAISFFLIKPTCAQVYNMSTSVPENKPSTQQPVSTVKPALPDSCNSILDPASGEISPELSDAARITLKDIQEKFPEFTVKKCVSLWPSSVSSSTYVDEQIAKFKTPGTVFMLFGTGIKSDLLAEDGACKNGASSGFLLPEVSKAFTINDSINITNRQMVVGIPLNDEKSLLKNHYVGLRHVTSSWFLSALPIKMAPSGGLISGITTLPLFQTEHRRSGLNWIDELISMYSSSESGKANKKSSVVIYNNELVMIDNSALSISYPESGTKDHTMDIKLQNNQFISCFTSVHGAYYLDFHNPAGASTQRYSLKAENNNFYGNYTASVVSVTVSNNLKSNFTNEHFHSGGVSADSSLALISNHNDFSPFEISSSTLDGAEFAINFAGYVELSISNSKLLGSKGAIEGEWSWDWEPNNHLKFVGNNNGNSYSTELTSAPCQFSAGDKVDGELWFINGVPCTNKNITPTPLSNVTMTTQAPVNITATTRLPDAFITTAKVPVTTAMSPLPGSPTTAKAPVSTIASTPSSNFTLGSLQKASSIVPGSLHNKTTDQSGNSHAGSSLITGIIAGTVAFFVAVGLVTTVWCLKYRRQNKYTVDYENINYDGDVDLVLKELPPAPAP